MEGRDEKGRFIAGNQAAVKYDEKYCDAIIEYFSVEPMTLYTGADGTPRVMPCRYPTFERFAANIGVDHETLTEWTKKYPRFRAAHARAMAMQRDILVCNAMTGAYNPNFAKFVASCTHGMVERTAVDVGNEGDKAFKVDITVVD